MRSAGVGGAIASRDIARGEHVFVSICAACHDGRVNPANYRWTPAQMRIQIRGGNRLMPPIPIHRLDDDDLEAVLAYLTTIDAVAGELPPEAGAATRQACSEQASCALETCDGEPDCDAQTDEDACELERCIEEECGAREDTCLDACGDSDEACDTACLELEQSCEAACEELNPACESAPSAGRQLDAPY